MAGLLVSVRSAIEARAALDGGAAVIDIKEPDRGPLGRADAEVWADVLVTVAGSAPVSVALGELHEWRGASAGMTPDFAGLSYRKLGLAGAGPDWADDWARLRDHRGEGPAWVAVAYADWELAGAPPPETVLAEAIRAGCAGLLIDTWSKSRPSPVDRSWRPLVARAQGAGLFVALAGGLDAASITRLAPLRPDLFAVRGAACGRGDRRAAVDPRRVSRLVSAAGGNEFLGTTPSRPALRPLS